MTRIANFFKAGTRTGQVVPLIRADDSHADAMIDALKSDGIDAWKNPKDIDIAEDYGRSLQGAGTSRLDREAVKRADEWDVVVRPKDLDRARELISNKFDLDPDRP